MTLNSEICDFLKKVKVNIKNKETENFSTTKVLFQISINHLKLF